MQIKFDVDILKFELLLLLFTKVNRLYKKRKEKYIYLKCKLHTINNISKRNIDWYRKKKLKLIWENSKQNVSNLDMKKMKMASAL